MLIFCPLCFNFGLKIGKLYELSNYMKKLYLKILSTMWYIITPGNCATKNRTFFRYVLLHKISSIKSTIKFLNFNQHKLNYAFIYMYFCSYLLFSIFPSSSKILFQNGVSPQCEIYGTIEQYFPKNYEL